MRGHRLIAPLGNHLFQADQLYALALQSGQFAFEHFEGLRIRVADQHG